MHPSDISRIIADGYDSLGRGFAEWNATVPSGGRRWFIGEVVARLRPGTTVLELGCGPGADAAALAEGRDYIWMDLSPVQLSIARDRLPAGCFVVGDLASIAFRPGSSDAIGAFTSSIT